MIIFMIAIIHITDWVHLNNHPIYQNGIKIFPFFLSWFFYKSGMFFKIPSDYREYIKKCYSKLARPWIVWSILSFFIWLVVLIINNTHTDFIHEFLSYCFYTVIDGCHISNIPLWFLFTLFMIKMIYPLFSLLRIKNVVLFVTLLITVQLVYCYKCKYGILVKPLWLYNTIIGMCFFCAGDILRNKQNSTSIVLVCFITYVFINIVDFSYVDIKNNVILFGNYMAFFISSICGAVLINNIFSRITPPIKDWIIIRTLSYIGKKSLLYLSAHWLVFDLFASRLNFKNAIYGFVIYSIIIFIFIPILDMFIARLGIGKWLGVR